MKEQSMRDSKALRVLPPDRDKLPGENRADVRSVGALEGSARGPRNIDGRLRLMRSIHPIEGAMLLDIGCGEGQYTVELARSFDEVQAIDVEPLRLDHFRAARPANVVISEMSGLATTFDGATFDHVTAIEVLEHVAEPAALFREAARVLRPGGRFTLTTPNRFWPFEQHGVLVRGRRFPGPMFPGLTLVPPLHRRLADADAFSAARLRSLARAAGLEIVGFAWMMPPLDSLSPDSGVHRVLDRLQQTPIRVLGQTIIGGFRKP